MMVSVSADVMNSPARVGLVKDILEITEHFSENMTSDALFGTSPTSRVVPRGKHQREMYMFIILSLLIDIHPLPVFPFLPHHWFCLLIVLICVSWTVGVMAMLGIKITLLTAMLPPLLIVICIPNLVFDQQNFMEYDRHENKIKALQRMIQKIGNASF